MGTAVVVENTSGGGGIKPTMPTASILGRAPLHLWDLSTSILGDTTVRDQGSNRKDMTVFGVSTQNALGAPATWGDWNCYVQSQTGAGGLSTVAFDDVVPGDPWTRLVIAVPQQATLSQYAVLLGKNAVPGNIVAPGFSTILALDANDVVESSSLIAGANTGASQAQGSYLGRSRGPTPTIFVSACTGTAGGNSYEVIVNGLVVASGAYGGPTTLGSGEEAIANEAPSVQGFTGGFRGEIYLAARFPSAITATQVRSWYKTLRGFS